MRLVEIGFLVVFLGMLIIIIGALSSDSDFFVGGIIGFIPFGFSEKKELFYVGMALTVALFMALLLFQRLS